MVKEIKSEMAMVEEEANYSRNIDGQCRGGGIISMRGGIRAS